MLIKSLGLRFRSLRSMLRIQLARQSGTRIGENCVVGPGCDIGKGHELSRRGAVEIGSHCELVRDVILYPFGGRIQLGSHIHLGPNVTIYGHGGVTIGNDTLVAMHCRILSSNHTVPALGTLIRSQPDVLRPTRIGRDVWLGVGVTILGGVNVGDGCIVGAGAVVVKDLPPGSIAVGIPAKITGRRPPSSLLDHGV